MNQFEFFVLSQFSVLNLFEYHTSIDDVIYLKQNSNGKSIRILLILETQMKHIYVTIQLSEAVT